MLIIGCGDIGLRIAAQTHAERPLYGVVCSDSSAQQLRDAAIQPIQLDMDGDYRFPDLPPQAQWIYLAPPQSEGSEELRLRRWLERTPAEQIPARLVYISTSGVYGDHQGKMVDEETPPHPITARAKRRLDAEQQLQHWCQQHGSELIILRVPGITGPGRLPLARLRSGDPLIHPEECPYTNLVDANFLAHVCLLVASRAPAGIYNVADRPALKASEYYLQLCAEHDIPPPPFISFAEAEQRYSPTRLSFLRESRQLDTRKLQRLLGQQPDDV